MNIENSNSPPSRVSLAPGSRDETIDRLYDVALDPERYETLLDHWESVVGPLRAHTNIADPQLLDDPLILNHFKRAAQFLDRLEDQTDDAQYQQALAPFEKVAALIADEAFAIPAYNSTAARLFGLAEGRSGTSGISVRDLPIDDADNAAVRGGILTQLKSNENGATVLRVRAKSDGELFVLRMQRITGANGKPMVLIASSAIAWPEGFADILKAAFDLTNAEAAIVEGLVRCGSVAEIAEDRKRSIDTIRAQIKSVLAKTETRSQVELVRLTLSMMDIANLTFASAPEPRDVSRGYATLKPRDFVSLKADAGRTLQYIVLGDPQGKPVVFLPLDYGLVRWPASAEAEAEKRGIRVVVPVRAGFGNSDQHAKGVDFAKGTVADYLAILDHAGVDQAPILALGSDSFHAFLLAQAAPERFSTIFACGGVLPLTQREQFERMDKWHRFILAGAKYTPHLLPFMVKAGFMLARKIGKRGFLHAVYGKSEADVATFEDPEILEAMITGSETALSETHSAHEAFSNQAIFQYKHDWTEAMAAIKQTAEVHLINGLQDPETPPGTLENFKAEHPWVHFHIYEDAGQLIFFKHWRDVLDRLAKHF